jgi:hypothetical protein
MIPLPCVVILVSINLEERPCTSKNTICQCIHGYIPYHVNAAFELGRCRWKLVQYSALRSIVTMTQTSGQASDFEPAYASMRTLSI